MHCGLAIIQFALFVLVDCLPTTNSKTLSVKRSSSLIKMHVIDCERTYSVGFVSKDSYQSQAVNRAGNILFDCQEKCGFGASLTLHRSQPIFDYLSRRSFASEALEIGNIRNNISCTMFLGPRNYSVPPPQQHLMFLPPKFL